MKLNENLTKSLNTIKDLELKLNKSRLSKIQPNQIESNNYFIRMF